MSTNAQYAAIPKIGSVSIGAANTNRDGTGTIAVVSAATPTNSSGTRYDRINIQATGTTNPGMVRLFLTEGQPGVPITSISFASTTATVTTAVAHGLASGQFVTIQQASPYQYNTTAVITVLNASSFSYVMTSAPTTNATSVGVYSSTPAAPVSRLWREILVSAITPSGTVPAWSSSMTSVSAADAGYLPLILPTGWSLRAATNNAESFIVTAQGGDFA